MTKSEALRFFIAAQDDPVLAAWVSVIYEYKLPTCCEVTSHDHWEALQGFVDHGLHSNPLPISGKRPSTYEVQTVLDRMRLLPEYTPTEIPMSNKPRMPANPFASNALVAKQDTKLAGLQSNSLPTAQSSMPLSPFGHTAPLRAPDAGLPLANPFGSKAAQNLQCQDPTPQSPLATLGNLNDVELEVYCCKTALVMEVADMHGEGEGALPGGQISVIDRVMHGVCRVCGREHHHSVGEVINGDEFR